MTLGKCVQIYVTVKNADAAVTLGGAVLGRAPQLVTLPADGDAFIGALPLSGGRRLYGVTRRLRIENGTPLPVPGGDVTLYDWGGGLYEAELNAGELPCEQRASFPFTIMQTPWEGTSAVLYAENGLWLAVEAGGRVQYGFSLGNGTGGQLAVRERLLLVATQGSDARGMVIARGGKVLLSLFADQVTLTDTGLETIQRLPTQRGHKRKTAYRIQSGSISETSAETGFFTREPDEIVSVSRALCEAILYACPEEAFSYLTPALQKSLTVEKLMGFLPAFDAVRELELAGGTLGLVLSVDADGIVPVQRVTFVANGEKIANIVAEDIGKTG